MYVPKVMPRERLVTPIKRLPVDVKVSKPAKKLTDVALTWPQFKEMMCNAGLYTEKIHAVGGCDNGGVEANWTLSSPEYCL